MALVDDDKGSKQQQQQGLSATSMVLIDDNKGSNHQQQGLGARNMVLMPHKFTVRTTAGLAWRGEQSNPRAARIT